MWTVPARARARKPAWLALLPRAVLPRSLAVIALRRRIRRGHGRAAARLLWLVLWSLWPGEGEPVQVTDRELARITGLDRASVERGLALLARSELIVRFELAGRRAIALDGALEPGAERIELPAPARLARMRRRLGTNRAATACVLHAWGRAVDPTGQPRGPVARVVGRCWRAAARAVAGLCRSGRVREIDEALAPYFVALGDGGFAPAVASTTATSSPTTARPLKAPREAKLERKNVSDYYSDYYSGRCGHHTGPERERPRRRAQGPPPRSTRPGPVTHVDHPDRGRLFCRRCKREVVLDRWRKRDPDGVLHRCTRTA